MATPAELQQIAEQVSLLIGVDLPALSDNVQGMLGRRNSSLVELDNWKSGSATGGPNGDGLYPLTESNGLIVHMVPSPAKLAAIFSNRSNYVIYPEDIDPLAGTGTSGNPHDDAIAVQGMWYAQFVGPWYPRPAGRPNARYRCGKKIIVDPSRNTFDGNNCTIGWDYKNFVNPNSLPNLVTADPGFDTGNGWIASPNDRQTASSLLYDGAVHVTQPADQHLYYERGQQLIVAAGQLMTFKLTMRSITKNTVGDTTFHDIILTLRNPERSTPAASIATGGNVTQGGNVKLGTSTTENAYSLRDDNPELVPGKVFTWTMTSAVDNPYLRIQSDAGFEIDAISVQIVPDNTCLLIRTGKISEGGNLRGHNEREFRNFKLAGRAGQSDFVDAVLFDTPKYIDSENSGQHSRVNWYNFDISENVGRGLIFQNRTYLCNFQGFRIVCGVAAIDSIAGFDAGENISFAHGNLGGGIAVRNYAGYFMRFQTVSMDFCTQWLVGSGITLESCWLEKNQTPGTGTFTSNAQPGSYILTNQTSDVPGYPFGGTITGPGIPPGTVVLSQSKTTNPDRWAITLSNPNTLTTAVTGATFTYYHKTVTNAPLIDCTAGGKIHIRNTMIQVDGATNTRLEAPFRVGTDGFLDIEANTAYNLDSRAGALCVGDGRFEFAIIGTGVNRNVDVINKRDDDHNILGEDGRFEYGGLNIPAFLAPTGAGQRRRDRTTIVPNITGSFNGSTVRGSTIVTGLSANPTSAFNGREMTGSQFPEGTVVVDYQTAGVSLTGTATVGSNTLTNVSPQPTSGTALGRMVFGTNVARGARVLSYSGTTIVIDKPMNFSGALTLTVPNVVIMSQPALTTTADAAAGEPLPYRTNSTDSAIMRITSAYPAFEGSRCLEIYKNLPNNDGLMAYIAVPCTPNRGFGSEIRWAVPPQPEFADGVTGNIFIQPFFRRIVDAEGDNPRITKGLQLTDLPKTGIPLNTGTEGWIDRVPFTDQRAMWRTLTISLNSPGLGYHDGFVPLWATHLVWEISMVNMPKGSRMLIDAVIGNNQ